MSDTRPPCPVREPTPTLDAFWLVVAPTGRPRFYTSPNPNALCDEDEALEMYERQVNPFEGQPIPPETLAIVSPIDYANALSYPTRYVRWCLDYNNGKNASVSLPPPIVLAAPPIIPASVLAEPVKPPPPVYAPFPPIAAKPSVVVPIVKPKGSLLSRFGSWFSSPVFK